MTGPELSFLEASVGRRSENAKHLSTVMANGRPVLSADIPLTVALTRAVLEAS